MGFGVWGLGFGVWGLGFGVWGLGFGVWGLGFGVWGLGFGVWGFGSLYLLGWFFGKPLEETTLSGPQTCRKPPESHLPIEP